MRKLVVCLLLVLLLSVSFNVMADGPWIPITDDKVINAQDGPWIPITDVGTTTSGPWIPISDE